MAIIFKAVGPKQANLKGDVTTVQTLLNENIRYMIPARLLDVDGRFGPRTEGLIRIFQQRVVGMATPDGVISPKGPTLRRLVDHTGPLQKNAKPAAAPPLTAKKRSAAPSGSRTISEEQYTDAARRLVCETAAVRAVAETETGIRSPFDSQNRPNILYERHYFSRLTGHKFDNDHPDISNRKWGGHGLYSEQYPKLERASALNKPAALMSCSWGAFQIMGENYKQAGFATVDAFVAAQKSIESQMEAFVTFCTNDSDLIKALRNKDWATFARIYNGAEYKKNAYDIKMKQNYEKFMRGV